MKLVADNSTVGGKLQCISALHSQEIIDRINTLTGRFASEGRESNPWKDGRVCPTVNAGIYNGEQSVTGCMLQTLMVCFSQCHVTMLCPKISYSGSSLSNYIFCL